MITKIGPCTLQDHRFRRKKSLKYASNMVTYIMPHDILLRSSDNHLIIDYRILQKCWYCNTRNPTSVVICVCVVCSLVIIIAMYTLHTTLYHTKLYTIMYVNILFLWSSTLIALARPVNVVYVAPHLRQSSFDCTTDLHGIKVAAIVLSIHTMFRPVRAFIGHSCGAIFREISVVISWRPVINDHWITENQGNSNNAFAFNTVQSDGGTPVGLLVPRHQLAQCHRLLPLTKDQ